MITLSQHPHNTTEKQLVDKRKHLKSGLDKMLEVYINVKLFSVCMLSFFALLSNWRLAAATALCDTVRKAYANLQQPTRTLLGRGDRRDSEQGGCREEKTRL
jgi:hypothetical protein